MPERVMVFIDGSNLYRCVKSTFNRTGFDLGKIANKLVAGRQLVRTYYYNAPVDQVTDPEGYKGQQKFFAALGWIPHFEIRLGKLVPRNVRYKCSNCGIDQVIPTRIQKGVDTRLAVDLVTLAVRDRYDVGIIVSGDADLVEAVRFIKDHSMKETENAFTLFGWAPELRAIAERKIILDAAFLADCWE